MGKVVRIDTLHYGDRLKCSANGSGVRIVIWFNFCDIRCTGCHNKECWTDNPNLPDFSDEHIQLIIGEMSKYPNLYAGLSILGGEPFAKPNIDDVLRMCEEFKSHFPDKNIWIWSGHTYDWLKSQEGEYGEKIEKIFSLCDFLVDGPFVENRRNISLRFRGSDNQHIINLKTGEVVE